MFQKNMFDIHHCVEMTHKNLEVELGILGDDENEGNSGISLDPNQQLPKRKRHTQHQIQEMKAFFNECPKPNGKQRKELASRLSLAPSQVNAWFQKRRSEMKSIDGNCLYDMLKKNTFHTYHSLDITHKTTENELGNMGDDENQSINSGTDIIEAPSGVLNTKDPNQQRPKRKHHTQHQIQEMEVFFDVCPHPNDEQRNELSCRLSLMPSQVKFWFQNKRTKLKAEHVSYENSQLRAEIERLRADNIRCREAFAKATCTYCGGPASIDEMSFGGQHFMKMANDVPLFRKEHLMRGTPETSHIGTPEETWTRADMCRNIS